jgi:methylenetetrahydrofolate--tRNA-(uracil-5-)-methyltransferase
MRPVRTTDAHQTDRLGELVCTNSFKSEAPHNAHGQLKREMRALGSILLASADESRVAAGSALAVDRRLFSAAMTTAVESEPQIRVVRKECSSLPAGPTVIATGPLTSNGLAASIDDALGEGGLAFFDAIAPILDRESLDEEIVFAAGRFDEDADYLNCPMSRDEYETFIEALTTAESHEGHDWDAVPYFEGCLPIEVMAARGADTLRFGPMKPIGLEDPRTGRRPWAVVQLRREDRAGQMWNMVGFQTRLRVGEQRRVFSLIPGLAGLPARPEVVFAGQLTGVEGYTESAASGILAGINLARFLGGEDPIVPPPTTMLGALFRYLRDAAPGRFQPMNSNWGLVEPLGKRVRDKREKRDMLAERAQSHFLAWMEANGLPAVVESVGASA